MKGDDIVDKAYESAMDEFVDKAINTDKNFSIAYKDKIYHFFQVYVGEGKFIYGTSFNTKQKYGFEIGPGYACDLEAIVADQTVYVMGSLFSVWKIPPYPEKIKRFEEEHTKEINYLIQELLPKVLSTLPLEDVDLDIRDVEAQARSNLLYGDGEATVVYKGTILSTKEFAAILLNIADPMEIALDYIHQNMDYWIKQKARVFAVNTAMKSRECVEDWEMELAEAVRSVEAKLLNVTFEYEGKEATAKIEPITLLRTLNWKIHFDSYEIKSADAFAEQLGVSSVDNIVLTCRDIVKVTYGRKTLYKRA